MYDLSKLRPTLQGWPRRSAQGAESKPESPLKLPGKTLFPEDDSPGPPRPAPATIKLPTKPPGPAAPAAGKSVPVVGKPQEFVGNAPEVEFAPDGSRELPHFQLQYQPAETRFPRYPLLWMQAATALAALLVGYALGWRHGGSGAGSAGSSNRLDAASLAAPTASEQRDLDAAFAALRSPRHAEAQQMFTVLVQKHPQWGSLHTQIALAALYANDSAAFEKLVNQGVNSGTVAPADGLSLLGQRAMDNKEYEDANHYLGQSVGADPSRAETYYYWGDCLLRWGQPNGAVEKFRAARLRNPNPTVDHVYLSKLWLAEIESGLEAADGSGALIDRALAAEQPGSPALFAAAARAIKAGQFDRAAADLTRARLVCDPATFRVMLQDPYFSEQQWRPEFAAFYPGGPKAQPPPVRPVAPGGLPR